MKKRFIQDGVCFAVLVLMLIILLAAICLVNLCAYPQWYHSDMYLDILYASKAWKEKSLFPENWMFGNQYYVVATPVIAALLCGFWEPPTAMAAASILISFLIVGSFLWMLMPVTESKEACLAGAVFLIASYLYFGDAHGDYNGWQLMFTMCSYYGIYAVNAFLAVGCYLRARLFGRKSLLLMLAVVCLLSFGTGMQSLRQTAIMTCPLIGMEILRCIYCRIRKQPVEKKPLMIVGAISVSNGLGLLLIRILDIPRNGIRASFALPSFSDMLRAIPENLRYAYNIFGVGGRFQRGFLFLMVLLCLIAVVDIFIRFVRRNEEKPLMLLIFFGIGIVAVFAAGVLAVLTIRMPYYFMVFPMMAFLIACAYADLGKWGKGLVLTILLLMMGLSYSDYHRDVLVPIKNSGDNVYTEVAEYLVENGYTTIYSEWDNCGEDVAIASGCQLQAGFWTWEYTPYEGIGILCDPNIYFEDPEVCVYLFRGMERVKLGTEGAQKRGVELTQLAYFPEGDLYLFSAPVNLMRLR